MNSKDIKVNENIGIIEYSAAVMEIASKFFDEDGNYTPHFGRINAMMVFFNYFISEDDLKQLFSNVPENAEEDYLLSNQEYLNMFNEALKGDDTYRLNFANAYSDALEIVNTRKSSLTRAIDAIGVMIDDMLNKFQSTLSEENVKTLQSFVDGASKIDPEKIAEGYVKSGRIKQIAKG